MKQLFLKSVSERVYHLKEFLYAPCMEYLDLYSLYIYIWVFPEIVVPQNGWFIMEIPIKMDDLGVPLFLETPICTINPSQMLKKIFHRWSIWDWNIRCLPQSCRKAHGRCRWDTKDLLFLRKMVMVVLLSLDMQIPKYLLRFGVSVMF